MRLPAALLIIGLLSGCGPSGSQPIKTNSSETAWRWAGAEVAIVGRPAGVAFDRVGARVAGGVPKKERVTARCATCGAAAVEFDVTTPAGTHELDAGIAEVITAQVVFPVEGTWTFEPFGGQIPVRAADSTLPPVLVVRQWSASLAPTCGPAQIEAAITSLARAFNAGDLSQLATAVNPSVDFSMSGAPLGQFVTQKRSEVGDYIRNRHLVGERIFPYLVYASAPGPGVIDLAVYFVRVAPDLPPSPSGYRRAFAGSRLSCSDLLLVRFNADLLRD